MTLHFAYGSNVSGAIMGARCRGAEAIGTATLSGWRFVINPEGFGSIAPRPGERVHGVLWRLSARDLAAINAYEGGDSGLYVRRRLPVRCGGVRARALGYIARRRGAGAPGPGSISLGGGGARGGRPPRRLRALPGARGAVAVARRACQGHRGGGMSAHVIRHVVIRGRVQGVGYRAFAEYTALDHGLAGWVRNRRDGGVEAVLAGPAA